MGKVDRETIQAIIAKFDIVDEIGKSYVKLTQRGSNHTGLCPFHNENSPSFTVSRTKQFYHCFGCGAHGNIIDFIMKTQNLGFRETLEMLGAKCGIPITPINQNDSHPNHNRRMLELLTEANNYFKSRITTPTITNYLAGRNINAESIAKFELGFASGSGHELCQAITNTKHDLELLTELGIIGGSHNHITLKYHNRLIIPIKNNRNQTIGFGARIIEENANVAKYINSPQSPVFSKRNNLFGLNIINNRDLHELPLFIVEGYTDVIMLHQANIKTAIATLGTSLTPEHTTKIFNYSKHICFCFDGDNAGYKAAQRALELILPFSYDGTEIEFLLLPDGCDPDTIINHGGKEEFMKLYQENVSPIESFLLQPLTSNQGNWPNLSQYATAVKNIHNKVNLLPNGHLKSLIQAKIIEISPNTNRLSQPKTPPTPPQLGGKANLKPVSIMTLALALPIQNPEICKLIELDPRLEIFSFPTLKLFMEIWNLTKLVSSSAELLENFREHQSYHKLQDLMHIDIITHGEIDGDFIQSVIKQLYNYCCQKHIKKLINKAQTTTLTESERIFLNKLINENSSNI